MQSTYSQNQQYNQNNNKPKSYTWLIILCAVIAVIQLIILLAVNVNQLNKRKQTQSDITTNSSVNKLNSKYIDMTGKVLYDSEHPESYWLFKDDRNAIMHQELSSGIDEYNVTYTVLYDEDAMKYISKELSDYDITYKSQKDMLKSYKDDDSFEHYIIIKFDVQSATIAGKEKEMTEDGYLAPFIGTVYKYDYTDSDEYKDFLYYDLVGMESADSYTFIEYEK